MTNELERLTRDYAVGIRAARAEPNPDWAKGHDLFFGKVVSLMAELSVEVGQDVHLVALDHDWLATCYRTVAGWFDLAGQHVNESEVCGMVQAGAWMVISDGTPWRYDPPGIS